MHLRGDRSGVAHCQLHRFRGVECVTHADEELTLGDADTLIGGMGMPRSHSPRAMTTARRTRPTGRIALFYEPSSNAGEPASIELKRAAEMVRFIIVIIKLPE